MKLESVAPEIVGLPTPVKAARWRRLLRRLDAVFLVLVGLPTVIAGIYYGLLTSDVFISESRFVVRSPQRSIQGGLGALLQGTVLGRSQDDTYSVHDYILSRDALHELDEKLKVRAAYGNHDISVFNRFPGLSRDDSFEAFYLFYQDEIQIDYDTASSITQLRVRAYTAEQAHAINEQLLQMGERLVNTVNLRSREDLILVAQHEVQEAEANAKRANSAFSALRAGRGVFDPEKQGQLKLESISKLQEELQNAEAQLTQLRLLSPQNPQILPLQTQIASLRKLIADESAKIAGGDKSLASNVPEFGRLALDKDVADRRLSSALVALDAARSEVTRKQMYLERLVQPNVPDVSMEPRRLRSVVTVFVVGLLVWAVASLLIASVREHTD